MVTKTTSLKSGLNGVPSDLASLGFESPSEEAPHRLLLGTEGPERSGKTELLLSAPGPIGILNFDWGLEGVVEKWVRKGRKKVWVYNVRIPVIAGMSPAKAQSACLSVLSPAKDAYFKMIEHADVRTVGIDTGSDLWALIRLADFGTLNPKGDVKQIYDVPNQVYKSFIRTVFNVGNKNLIVTHRLAPHYVNDKWDGESYKREGFRNSGYLIQSNLIHRFHDGEFSIEVKDCRQNPSLAGMVFTGSDCTFPRLASCILEDTVEGDWK